MLVIVTRDISSIIELEKEKHGSMMKTVAFASAAHEFRNPLNGIISSLDIMLIKRMVMEGDIYFVTAKNCSILMLSLINDVLDFS